MALDIEQGKGVLFPNDYKVEGDKKPDYTGEVELPQGYTYSGPNLPEGVSPSRLRIVIWDNTSKAGQPYRSADISTPRPPKPKPTEEDPTPSYLPTGKATSKTELPF